jgi:hypothetical protein
MTVQPEPVLRRHADHDPSLTCRPALGHGLCEVLERAEADPAPPEVPAEEIGA